MDISPDTVLPSHKDPPQIRNVEASEVSDVPQSLGVLADEVATNLDFAIKRSAHDPYKAPPQALKKIFKELRAIKDKDDSRIAGYRILDFSVGQAESEFVLPIQDNVLDVFLLQRPVNTPEALGTDFVHAKAYTAGCVNGIAIMPNLIPPLVQQILLNRLLHRDLSNPQHQTNLHLHYDISYPGDGYGHSFFSASHSDVLFKPKDPKVHKELRMNQVLEKKLRWMTLGGQYDWTNKTYPAEDPPEFPPDIKNLISGLFRGMLDPQAAILNIYSPGDTLSLHRDVSEQCDNNLISISLGCECLFLVAVEDDTDERGFKHAVIRLRSGDALVMMGEGRFAWHGVPKIFPDTCPDYLQSWPNEPAGQVRPAFPQWEGWMKNKRINLNVRQMR